MATLLMVESWLQSTGIVLPSLIRERGHDYVLVTRDPSLYAGHPVLSGAGSVLIAETNDPAALTAAVESIGSRVDGVLTTCDYYLEAAAECAVALGLPGPSPDVMRTATRKDLVRDTTCRAGLPSPRFAVAMTWESCHAAAARIGYPCVVKPVDLNSGSSVHLVVDEVSLKDAFGDITGATANSRGRPRAKLALLEEYLVGREVSVEAVTVGGRTHVLGITGKVVDPATFIECGHRFPALLGDDDQRAVEALARDALAALGFDHGVSHTEVKLTTDGPRLVEVNPRQGGGHIFELVSLVTGVNPLALLIDLALGDEPRLDARGTAPSAAVSFVLPEPGGSIRIDPDALAEDPLVHRWELESRPGLARDNNDRLGYVMTVGRDPLRHAQSITGQLGRGLTVS